MSDSQYSKGALVYLPAGARLLQFKDGNPTPYKWCDIPKPTNVLFIETAQRYCEVIYGGERWNVDVKDVYPMRAEKNE